MVYKKFQVYDWFKTLDGAKRIDFLNGMLHLCFPLELRFLGSCIEELARKDFMYLQDAELKANSMREIHMMRDLCDKITRSKMIVTLALLGSSNVDCAKLLYDILNIDIGDLLERMRENLNLDEKIADEFLLMLTMAANHPAFDFQMKTRMSQLYLLAEHRLRAGKVIVKESESEMFLFEENNLNNNQNSPNVVLKTHEHVMHSSEETKDLACVNSTASCNLNQNGEQTAITELNVDTNNNRNNDPEFIANIELTHKNLGSHKNNNTSSANNGKPVFTTSSSTSSLFSNMSLKESEELVNIVNLDCNQSENKKDEMISKSVNNTSLNEDDGPLIEAINFEGVQTIKGTENYKFIIKIKWSDNTSNEIDKTYSELCEFNKQLINLFPEELNGLIESSQLVLKENQKEDFIKELPLVTNYCSKIATLPKIVCKSNFLRNFFRSNANQLTSTSTTSKNAASPQKQTKTSHTDDAIIKSSDSNSNLQLGDEHEKMIQTVKHNKQTISSPNKKAEEDENEFRVVEKTKEENENSITESYKTENNNDQTDNNTEQKPLASQQTRVKNAVVSVAPFMNNNNNSNSQQQNVNSNSQQFVNHYKQHNQQQILNQNNYQPLHLQQKFPQISAQSGSSSALASPPCVSPRDRKSVV